MPSWPQWRRRGSGMGRVIHEQPWGVHKLPPVQDILIKITRKNNKNGLVNHPFGKSNPIRKKMFAKKSESESKRREREKKRNIIHIFESSLQISGYTTVVYYSTDDIKAQSNFILFVLFCCTLYKIQTKVETKKQTGMLVRN